MRLHALVVLGMVLTGCAHTAPAAVTSATSAAQAAWTCPVERLATVEVAAATRQRPPADIARDPQRLAVWNNADAAKPPVRQYIAYGCGRVGLLRCNYADNFADAHGRAVDGWWCGVYEVGALRPDEEAQRPSYQRAVRELIAQLQAHGDAVGVQAVTPSLDALAPAPPVAPPPPPATGPPAPPLPPAAPGAPAAP